MLRFAFVGALLLLSTSAQAAFVSATYTDSFVGPPNTVLLRYWDGAGLAGGFQAISINGTPLALTSATPIVNPDTVPGPSGVSGNMTNNTGSLSIVNGAVFGVPTGDFMGLTGALTLVSITSVPEPSMMGGILLLSIAGIGRRRQRHQLV